MTNKEKLQEINDLISRLKAQTNFNGELEVFVEEDFEDEEYFDNNEVFGFDIDGRTYDLLVKYYELEDAIKMFFEGYVYAQTH